MINKSDTKLVERTEEENRSFIKCLEKAMSSIEEATSEISYSLLLNRTTSCASVINGDLLDELNEIVIKLEELKESKIYKPVRREE